MFTTITMSSRFVQFQKATWSGFSRRICFYSSSLRGRFGLFNRAGQNTQIKQFHNRKNRGLRQTISSKLPQYLIAISTADFSIFNSSMEDFMLSKERSYSKEYD